MEATWTTLASGSGGNSSLLHTPQGGLLVDLGLGPRQFDNRLAAIGSDWSRVRAVVLTHTHADHWNGPSVARLVNCHVPFFCHADHVRPLQLNCRTFAQLQFAGLVRTYAAGRPFVPVPGMTCTAVELNHDGGPTFGFRIEADDAGEDRWAVGYAADLGSWDQRVARCLADVDILALEFNHDVELQRNSGRARWLINRVLGDSGHLSNVQAAELLAHCLQQPASRPVRHVIQLHLSRECNRASLAVAAARDVIDRLGLVLKLHTAEQDRPGPVLRMTRTSPQPVLP